MNLAPSAAQQLAALPTVIIEDDIPIPEVRRISSTMPLAEMTVGQSYEFEGTKAVNNLRARIHKLRPRGLRFTIRKLEGAKSTYRVWRQPDEAPDAPTGE